MKIEDRRERANQVVSLGSLSVGDHFELSPTRHWLYRVVDGGDERSGEIRIICEKLNQISWIHSDGEAIKVPHVTLTIGGEPEVSDER